MLESHSRFSRAAKWAISIVILILAGAEVSVRLAGFVDFPLYEANAQIGYVLKPNQTGLFMNRNDWIFNEYSMGTGPFNPDPEKINVLLIGDSIVYGGNSYKQTERLITQLENVSAKIRVWPISAGSWALQNELTWLEQHPEVVNKVDRIDFILNSGDFKEPSSWKCETTHPTHRPKSALLYLVEKNIWDWSRCAERDSPSPVISRDWRPRLKLFLAKQAEIGRHVVFHLYPNQKEYNNKATYNDWASTAETDLRKAGAKEIQRLFADATLPDNYYKDDIHPTAPGVNVLAKHLLITSH